MNKLIPIVLLFLSPLVTAQEKEIWACQAIEGTELVWIFNRWNAQSYTRSPAFMLTHEILVPYDKELFAEVNGKGQAIVKINGEDAI
jgi:hypothetical protein